MVPGKMQNSKVEAPESKQQASSNQSSLAVRASIITFERRAEQG
jgi:hypothetical protein